MFIKAANMDKIDMELEDKYSKVQNINLKQPTLFNFLSNSHFLNVFFYFSTKP